MSNYRVLIPDCIIRNGNGINLNPKEFVLYCFLKMRYDRLKRCDLKVNHNDLMCEVKVKTNSTFKNMLNKFFKNKLITNYINELPKHKPLQIELNEEYINIKPFTMISVNLIRMLPLIGYEGIRLIYYYESRINRKSDVQFCFAGVRTIAKETKISTNKVTQYNNKLVDEGVLKISKHELKKYTTMYNDDGDELITKFNNHYSPLIKNIEKFDMSKIYL